MSDISEYIISTLLVLKNNVYEVHRYNTRRKFLDLHPEIEQYLNEKYSDCNSIQEKLYRLVHNIVDTPKCKCGNFVKFKSFSKGYHTFCSLKCAENDEEVRKKISNTLDIKYGKDRHVITEKIKQTNISKYGCENPMQNELIKEKTKNTNIKKYGVVCTLHAENIRDKVKEAWIKTYGCENPMQNIHIKEKARKTNIIRYGCNNPMQNELIKEKTKNSNIKKYGCDNVFQNENVKSKIKQTNIKRYGVPFYSQTDLFLQTIKEKTPGIQQNIHNTKKLNNSFHISKPEKECYAYLKQKYPDIISQYRSEKYPFNCDFYIPSLDLYIEFNGHWTHGKHPFDPDNKEDILILEKWKSSDRPFYKTAINVWTIKDPYKRKIAKENNLNFLEIWSLKNIENII